MFSIREKHYVAVLRLTHVKFFVKGLTQLECLKTQNHTPFS